MTDSIEDTRARHKAVNELVEYELPSQMHDDREMLLAEVDRLTRERDEARYFLKIFLHAHANGIVLTPHIEQQAHKALEAKP